MSEQQLALATSLAFAVALAVYAGLTLAEKLRRY